MSIYKSQESDFISRTLSILDQYDSLKFPKDEKYEVTLMLNCMVGLLILPQQEWISHLPTELISKKEWGIDASHISYLKIGEAKSVNVIARHLRNSLAHSNFIAFSNKSSEITRVKFVDWDRQQNKTFESEIPIADLKTFLRKFATVMLDLMKKQ